MKRIRAYHVLFGVALLVMGALSSWWLVFFLRAIEQERELQYSKLTHVTVVSAMMLGQRSQPPPVGAVLKGRATLQVIRADQREEGDLFSPLVPRYPEIGVRPEPFQLKAIDDKIARRRLMFLGEGHLFILLLFTCTYMLYRLVRSERRHIRRMEAFLSTVTHEMKTPLTGIKSMLQTFAADKVPDEQREMLYSMGLKEAERLEHMVENVLASGRLRAKRYQVYKEAMSLRGLLNGFVEHRRRYLVERPEALELVWEPAGVDITVMCDPGALNLVFENLTDNAFKYGGQDAVVTVRVTREQDRVLVSVEDGGIGFDSGSAEELFVPFHRAMDAREEAQHGTGLGLAIARALVEKMDGRLTAHSEGPGTGSRFTISLKEAQV